MEDKKKKHKGFLTVLLIILLVLLLGTTCTCAYLIYERKTEEPEIDDRRYDEKPILTVDPNAKPITDATSVFIDTALGNTEEPKGFVTCGIPDATIDKKTQVSLQNLNEDHYYVKYEVIRKRDNVTLFETDYIPPQSYILWTPGESLSSGSNVIIFRQVPYSVVDGEYIKERTIGEIIATLTMK